MNTDHKIAQIYDWMETMYFKDLNSEQQTVVLEEMDRFSYDEMRTSILQLSHTKVEQQEAKDRVKSNVLAHIPAQQAVKIIPIWSRTIPLRHAAAWTGVLLAAFLWLLWPQKTDQGNDMVSSCQGYGLS